MNVPLFIYADYPSAATVTATGAVAGQVADDVLQANEDTYLSPTGSTLTITIDMGVPTPISCIAAAGENLPCLLQVYGSTDNFASSNVTILSGFNAAYDIPVSTWVSLPVSTYRYYKTVFSGIYFPSLFKLYHVALSAIRLLPLMEDGADLVAFQTSSSHIISPQGHLLGIEKQKTERKLSLTWGQVQEDEYQQFLAWAVACVYTPKGFFFVPDSSATTCYFGRLDPDFTFSAPMKMGLRSMPKIPFTSRYA